MNHTWWLRTAETTSSRYIPGNIQTDTLAIGSPKITEINKQYVDDYRFDGQDLIHWDLKILDRHQEIQYGSCKFRPDSEIFTVSLDKSDKEFIDSVWKKLRNIFKPFIQIYANSLSADFDIWELMIDIQDYTDTKVLMSYGKSKSIEQAYTEDNIPSDRLRRTHPVVSSVLTFQHWNSGRIQAIYENASFTTREQSLQEFIMQKYEQNIINDE